MHLMHDFDQLMLRCNRTCTRIMFLRWPRGNKGWTFGSEMEKREMEQKPKSYTQYRCDHDRPEAWACDNEKKRWRLWWSIKQMSWLSTWYNMLLVVIGAGNCTDWKRGFGISRLWFFIILAKVVDFLIFLQVSVKDEKKKNRWWVKMSQDCLVWIFLSVWALLSFQDLSDLSFFFF